MFCTFGGEMTALELAPWLLATLILSGLAVVASAVACWIAVSRASQLSKSLHALAQTPPSDVKLAQAMADQAELFSTLEKLTTTVKRLSSRAGMREVQADEPPPKGASKAELRRYYGFERDGPDFARRQMQLVPKE
jgi:hypothetical protein